MTSTRGTSEDPAGWARRPILVIGLDGAEPSLVFDRWRQDLPTIDRLLSGESVALLIALGGIALTGISGALPRILHLGGRPV